MKTIDPVTGPLIDPTDLCVAQTTPAAVEWAVECKLADVDYVMKVEVSEDQTWVAYVEHDGPRTMRGHWSLEDGGEIRVVVCRHDPCLFL